MPREERDHSFNLPVTAQFQMGWRGRVLPVGVLCEQGEERIVAKLCFLSYMHGPGVKIVADRGTMEDD